MGLALQSPKVYSNQVPLYVCTVSHGPGCEEQLGPDATLISEEAGECQGPDGLVVVELVVVVLLLGVALELGCGVPCCEHIQLL